MYLQHAHVPIQQKRLKHEILLFIAYSFGHPEPEKKSVGIFEYILAFMLKVYLDVF